MEKIHAQ
jgi:hypothetical protein